MALPASLKTTVGSSFPSVALGWKLKEENFLKNVEVLSDLKLRLGWGITGQQNLGDDYDFPYMALYRVNAAGGYCPFGDTVLWHYAS